MKLYALMELKNNYDCTPDVVALWKNKPTLNAIARKIHGQNLEALPDDHIVKVVRISRGEEVRFDEQRGPDWSMEEMATED